MNEVDHNYLKHFQMNQRDILVDIGASGGDWGAEILPELQRTDSLLVCLEPAPWCVERLARWVNDEAHGHATVLSAAITWGRDDVVPLVIADSHLVSHLEGLPGDPKAQWGAREVRTDPVVGITLETLTKTLGRVSMVKMDIEGAEVPVITTADDETLARVNNFTIAAYHDYEGKKTWEILLPFLESKGFKCLHECLPYKHFPAMDMLYATKDGSF